MLSNGPKLGAYLAQITGVLLLLSAYEIFMQHLICGLKTYSTAMTHNVIKNVPFSVMF